jgi:hypothetical protein
MNFAATSMIDGIGLTAGLIGWAMKAEKARADRGRIGARSDDDPEAVPQREYEPKTRLRTISDLDGRTRATRLALRLLAGLEADLGGDLSAAQRELVKRAALLGAIVEDCEARWLERRPADLTLYGMLVDRQRRILEALGLERKARDVTPPHNPTDAIIAAIRREAA